MTISLLVAADEDNIIGRDNKLPWNLPNDLRYFKNRTWGLPVIMGRKTFQSLGKPLQGRKTIIITRNKSWKPAGADIAHSIEEATQIAEKYGAKEIFIIGGAEIFKTAFTHADRIYITRIHHRFGGDARFPEISLNEWNLMMQRYCAPDQKNAYPHTFQVWEHVRSELRTAVQK